MKGLEANDPFELVGVTHPHQIEEETDRETARCIIEDYALTGFAASEILELFASPTFGLPHGIYQRRGADFVRALLNDVFGGGE